MRSHVAERGGYVREYVRGRLSNCRGPRRRTVAEPDPLAVDLLASGYRDLVVAAVERDAAIDALDRTGLPSREVAVRLGITQRTVVRRRAARRAEARRALLAAVVVERFGALADLEREAIA